MIDDDRDGKIQKDVCTVRDDSLTRVGGMKGGGYEWVGFDEDGLFSNVGGCEGTPSWG